MLNTNLILKHITHELIETGKHKLLNSQAVCGIHAHMVYKVSRVAKVSGATAFPGVTASSWSNKFNIYKHA